LAIRPCISATRHRSVCPERTSVQTSWIERGRRSQESPQQSSACDRVRARAMSEAIPGMQEAPPPAEHKDAAVVVLVRMGPRGLETFWLRRERTVSFAAGFYGFPGGRVDAGDAEVPVEGAGPPDSRLVAAAARELFEETGVLAARGRTPDLPVLATARAALLEGKETFPSVLTRLGLQVDALD